MNSFDALDVEKVQDIPNDYDDVMGVPLSYLSYYCPKQFKIIGMLNGGAKGVPLDKGKAIVNGKEKYTRILIKKVHQLRLSIIFGSLNFFIYICIKYYYINKNIIFIIIINFK